MRVRKEFPDAAGKVFCGFMVRCGMILMGKDFAIENGAIVINRKLTDLDRFVRSFLDVLKKRSDYLIVSGFVSIATGRARGTLTSFCP